MTQGSLDPIRFHAILLCRFERFRTEQTRPSDKAVLVLGGESSRAGRKIVELRARSGSPASRTVSRIVSAFCKNVVRHHSYLLSAMPGQTH